MTFGMAHETVDDVLACPSLPTLPKVALDVLELVRDDDVRIEELAEVIRHDQALTSRVLRAVNSSYYRRGKPITTISRAIAYLGIKAMSPIVLGFSLAESMRAQGEFDHVRYWRRTLLSAIAARVLARHFTRVDAEETFTAALLQDMGVLAIQAVLGDRYSTVWSRVAEHDRLAFAERAVFGFDHVQVGTALAEKWHFPDKLVTLIRHHPAPDDAPEPLRAQVRCIALGGRAADALAHDDPVRHAVAFVQDAAHWFAAADTTAVPLLEQIDQEMAELAPLFDVPAMSRRDVALLLAEANEHLLRQQMILQQETERLQRQNELLSEQSTSDDLTGLPNRRYF